MSHRLKVAALAVSLALVGAACGGSDSESSSRTKNVALNDCVNAVGANATSVANATAAVSVAATDLGKKKATYTKTQKAYSKERKRKPVNATNLKKTFGAYKKARAQMQISFEAYTQASTTLAITAAAVNCVVSAEAPAVVAPPVTVAAETNLATSTDVNGADIGAGTNTNTTVAATVPPTLVTTTTAAPTTTIKASTTTMAPTTSAAPVTTAAPKLSTVGSIFRGAGPNDLYSAIATSTDGGTIAVMSGNRVLISRDKGATYTSNSVGSDNVEVAVSPNGSAVAVVSKASKSLWLSVDSGKSFKQIALQMTPSSVAINDAMVFIGGTTGVIKSSYDSSGANSWVVTTAPTANFKSIAISNGGPKSTVVYGIVDGFGYVYRSLDGGVNWVSQVGSEQWQSVRSSDDGKHAIAEGFLGATFVTHDTGASWARVKSPPGFPSLRGAIDIDNSGQNLIASNWYSQKIAISRDGGSTWTESSVNPSVMFSYNYVVISGDASVVGVAYPCHYTGGHTSVS